MARKPKPKAAPPMIQHFDVVVDMPELGLRYGDSVSYEAANLEEPWLMHRPIAVASATMERAAMFGLIKECARTPAPAATRSGGTSVAAGRPVTGLRLVK